ncbi:catalase [Nocardioides yefusunii]|uniref:Catalase n=1 Tax=Nocardioides yefusunii TaxID=2500546 RepID=A0ABW1QRV7_9ACTN|nr:catalase [Nocardioides yefusunii]
MEPSDLGRRITDALRGDPDEKNPDLTTHGLDDPAHVGGAKPSLEEPTEPRDPLPPRPDQRGAADVSPTGAPCSAPGNDARAPGRTQQGAYLTTAQGARLRDTDHSLKAGRRGPTLLQDHHLREKITHFDHERIPERVVHARGAAAHGRFESYGTATDATCAPFLAEGVVTPVFVRFSTVLGSRGSADTVRDTRGFATKFYTPVGTFDLVANNIPVFFIKDGIKFPDVVHAAKPHPDREIPQAQSAHDTFWDFVTLHPEAQHHTIWNMSDRGIPRSYRMMEGFGVHTFRLVDAEGGTSLAKFHWKPVLGVHSLTWEEAQTLAGADPDYHRRDLYDSIEAGHHPQWELGVQAFPDTPEQTFEGIDLLDPTKLVPEELAPVQRVGRLTLDANPRNFFAETEQVAFHPGHLPPGIDVTDDPLLQARLFSYLDTQLTRLGGPNFGEIPINRPQALVNDMLRDGFHQQADHAGVAPYKPNSLDGGCPFMAGPGAFTDLPVRVTESVKERADVDEADDPLRQVRLFWDSLSDVEREHVAGAFAFELASCREAVIRERQVNLLAQVSTDLATTVATSLGLPAPALADASVPDRPEPSPALSQVGRTWPVAGRKVALVVDPGHPLDDLGAWLDQLHAAGVVPVVVAPHGGTVEGIEIGRTLTTARSVEFDAVLFAGAPLTLADARPGIDVRTATFRESDVDPRVLVMAQEAWRHCKAIGAWGLGGEAVHVAGVPEDAVGVVVAGQASEVIDGLVEHLAAHRVWDRFPAVPLT